MATSVAFILGRSVWMRESSGWRPEPFEFGTGSNIGATKRFREFAATHSPCRMVLIFEPFEMVHECIETPKVDRAVFATLARIKRDHPVVAATNLGWGIEWPEPASGGTYSTLIHSEMAPSLVNLKEAFANAKCRLTSAWSGYTAVEALMKSRLTTPGARYGVVLTCNFVAIATCDIETRSFRSWAGPMAERDWRSLFLLLSKSDEKTTISNAKTESRLGGIVVIAEQEPSSICPFWNDNQFSSRVEAVVGLDSLAEAASKIPTRHPANLLEAFPRPFNLDRYLIAAAITGIAASITFAGIASNDTHLIEATEAATKQRITDISDHLGHLRGNQREMHLLRAQVPDSSDYSSIRIHSSLLELAEAIPDELTLTSLSIDRTGRFEIEALVVGESLNSDLFRDALLRNGFTPDKPDGWKYNVARGALEVRGKYHAVHQ